MNNIRKFLSIFKSPALKAIYRWSKPVHRSVFFISVLGVFNSILSLGVTLVTKNLIDGAVSGQLRLLWRYGGALVLLIVIERLAIVLSSYLRLQSSVRFQLTMQQMVTRELMGKDYAAIKPYHSGQLVNRVFSDVSVVKNGIMSLLPSYCRSPFLFSGLRRS